MRKLKLYKRVGGVITATPVYLSGQASIHQEILNASRRGFFVRSGKRNGVSETGHKCWPPMSKPQRKALRRARGKVDGRVLRRRELLRMDRMNRRLADASRAAAGGFRLLGQRIADVSRAMGKMTFHKPTTGVSQS